MKTRQYGPKLDFQSSRWALLVVASTFILLLQDKYKGKILAMQNMKLNGLNCTQQYYYLLLPFVWEKLFFNNGRYL